MKKLWIILILSFLTGCSNMKIAIQEEEIQKIFYDDITLLDKEKEKISHYFQDLDLAKGTLKEEIFSTLTIITQEDRMQFNFTKDQHLLYQKDGISYYTKDALVIDLFHDLEKIKSTYTNDQFYSITEATEYENDPNDVFIRLDNSDHYFIIDSRLSITNFRIHRIEEESNQEIDLIYQNEFIEQNHRIVIRVEDILFEEKLRFTFTTPYQYGVSIVPIYDSSMNQFSFQTTFRQKENA